jgi:hypothetical protein
MIIYLKANFSYLEFVYSKIREEPEYGIIPREKAGARWDCIDPIDRTDMSKCEQKRDG